ncbi:beta-propeller fold lactonase family protein [Bacteriovorax sp. PP10]|uniref:Beta-propeller fold lactonase family protein n=1 Tax=Bacteriovorax antarcticus TaxID=3088717 RepID=A0ABU5W1H2_9BACT|nr:beta-propeller fold lactonase family protein [Bacteriovorax sp. PP10]MEA9358478.1 beta-propeller fold lactonase family protein [Bacteriovorax sp. PP10]
MKYRKINLLVIQKLKNFIIFVVVFTIVNALANDKSIEGSVWVANEDDNSITIINARNNKVLTTLTEIESPHNLQVSPDNKTVWIVSGHKALAIAVDVKTYALKGVVATGKMPAHIIISPDGKSVYVTNGEDNSVSIIDVRTMKAISTIPTGKQPHGLRTSPDGKWIYVANASGTTISVIETASNKKIADIEVGKKPVQVGFSPDGKYAYVSLNAENVLAKIDVSSKKTIAKVAVGVGPIQVFVSPNNKYILVANQGTEQNPSTTTSIVDIKTFTVVKTVNTGKGAHGVVIESLSRFAYITNMYENTIAILDLKTLKIVASTPTGIKPNGISYSRYTPTATSSSNIAIKLPEMKSSNEINMKH